MIKRKGGDHHVRHHQRRCRALKGVVATYRGGLAAVEAELTAWAVAPPLAATVARLGAYRGIAQLTGLTLVAEVVNWRRFILATGVIPADSYAG